MGKLDQYREVREQVVRFAKRMLAEGMVVGAAGNVSSRIPGTDLMAITPSSLPYEEMTGEDVQILDRDGNPLTEGRPPSVERAIHAKIYGARPDVGAIFHTHALFCSVLACLRKSLPVMVDEFVPQIGGAVDVAPYALSGSEELAGNVVKSLGDKRAVILANHGNVCCGRDLDQAFRICHLVERAAQIYLFSLLAGTPHLLPDEVVEMEKGIYNALRAWERK